MSKERARMARGFGVQLLGTSWRRMQIVVFEQSVHAAVQADFCAKSTRLRSHSDQ